MLQRSNKAVALQDAAHCDIHSTLQGESFTHYQCHIKQPNPSSLFAVCSMTWFATGAENWRITK